MPVDRSVDEETDPAVAARPRGPSPTPVSHVGAAQRRVSSRIGGAHASPLVEPTPSTRRLWLPLLLVALGAIVLVAVITALATLPLPARLGSWAAAPEQGIESPFEPVELDAESAPPNNDEAAEP